MVSYSAVAKAPLEKVWSHLIYKIEHPEHFVPGVNHVAILERAHETVIRVMHVNMAGNQVVLKEKITFQPYKVRFELLEHPTMQGFIDNDARALSENETAITFTAHWKNKATGEEINNTELLQAAVLKTIAFIEDTI